MSGVDNRIVTMKFDNAQFEQGARTSLSTLERIKSGIGKFGSVGATATKALGGISNIFSKFGIKNPFATAEKGAADLGKTTQGVASTGLSALEGGVTGVSAKFIALSTVAITALTNITNKAINSGAAFLKSFSIAPIMDGLREYELNLQSIQTVQANTDRPLPEIEAALEQLNKYSDQTIYNFAEMAKNVGTFTAAGVDLQTSVSSIKGIANLAALSGSSSQQAATAMYQLSQAISSGRVGLQDWNSVVNAGMGGKKLQNALAQTAIAMGDIGEESVKLEGPMKKLTINGKSFRESIMAQPGQESWLSSDILVNTLATMDGRFSKAALSAEKTEEGLKKYTNAQIEAKIAQARLNLEQKNGVKYTDEQFAALQKMSTMAFKSATEVKTLGQVFDIAKETIASGWSASFKNIFGGLKDAKKLFTGMSVAINGIIEQDALARNRKLFAWADGGGRADVIEGFANAWKTVLNILGPIKEGFRDIFPAKEADDLISMSENFKNFTASLIPGEKTMGNIRDIAGGVFAVFGIGAQILGGVVTMFKTIFASVGGGAGNFLGLAGGVGNAVQAFNDFLKESGIVTAFFTKLGEIIAIPIKFLAEFAGMLSSLFTGVDVAPMADMTDSFDKFQVSGEKVTALADRIKAGFSRLGDALGTAKDYIVDAIAGIGGAIGSTLSSASFEGLLGTISVGLLGGIAMIIKKFFKDGGDFGINVDASGGIFGSIKDTLGEATGVLENMQASLKADVLIKIAGALAILAGSLFLLSTIDAADLAKALAAMAAGFIGMQVAMVALNTSIGVIGAAKLPLIAASMVLISLSLVLLAGAVKLMGSMDLFEIALGLATIGGVLFVLNKAMTPLAKNSAGMVRAAAAIAILGVALNILGAAMLIFASFDWEQLTKGLAGIAGALVAISIGMQLMPKGMLLQAASILVLSVALNALGVAMKIFATMSLAEMGKGALALAGSLTLIAGAMRLMPKSMVLQAAGLVLVATALVGLGTALKVMGTMSVEEIAKGLGVLGGAMVILALGLNAMGPMAMLGAASLVITAGALALLVPVLATLGALSLGTIITSLGTLAAVFVILGVAGTFVGPLVPVLLGLGVALILIAASFAIAGVGAMAFATAIALIGVSGAATIAILGDAIDTLIQSIPAFLLAVTNGVIAVAVTLAKAAPKFARAFFAIGNAMLSEVNKMIPKLGQTFVRLITTLLNVVVKLTPRIVTAGLRMLLEFLSIIDRNIYKITTIAVSIITKFIKGVADNLDRIIQAGVNLILKFINGVSKAIENNSEELGAAGATLGVAIIKGIGSGISGGVQVIKDAAREAAKAALKSAMDFFKVNSPSKVTRDKVGRPFSEGIAVGIEKDIPMVEGSAKKLGRTAMDTITSSLSGISDAVSIDPNMNPTVTPVLDLSSLTKEANKMSSILATAPIMAGVSYQAAADISSMTQASAQAAAEANDAIASAGGDTYVTLEHNLYSPKALDSVAVYRDGKSLISLAKEALS